MKKVALFTLAVGLLLLAGCERKEDQILPPGSAMPDATQYGSSPTRDGSTKLQAGRAGGMAPQINQNAPDAAARLGTKVGD
jgi:hypothetical protein